MCPFDTYKIYKRGANVRVDTTLVGFENNRWQRGDRTYIFRGQGMEIFRNFFIHKIFSSLTLLLLKLLLNQFWILMLKKYYINH